MEVLCKLKDVYVQGSPLTAPDDDSTSAVHDYSPGVLLALVAFFLLTTAPGGQKGKFALDIGQSPAAANDRASSRQFHAH